jgi:penicillin-binding protein-related factor A (putative recombinase)
MMIHGLVQPTTADKLEGGDFEHLITSRLDRLRKERLASVQKPGVFANTINRFPDGTVRARLIESFPDFQGVFGTSPAREVMFDAKVCGQASFPLSKFRAHASDAKTRQLRLMYERARFGSVCFFLLHWTPRELKTKSDDAVTHAFPVSEDHPFWIGFESGIYKSIKRVHCEEYGFEIPWTVIGTERIPKPDLMLAFHRMAGIKVNTARTLRSSDGWHGDDDDDE